MTLLVLSYHHARAGEDGNAPEMLDEHFRYIAENCVNVLPGDPLLRDRHCVCLSFEGAYHDFYATVFPMLRKHRLRAVLAVAPALIREEADTQSGDQTQVDSGGVHSPPNRSGFCTWRELEELAESGRIAFAAHGYTQRRLDTPGVDLQTEVHVPRTLLATRLRVSVESFVFPFGRVTRAAVEEARSGYRYLFGNGNAVNDSWNHRGTLHQINADDLRSPVAPFESSRLMGYRLSSLWHRIRGT